MILLDGRVVLSASDLRTASACEFALVVSLDALRGRRAAVEDPDDAMLARVSALGDQHEQAELRRLSELHAGGVRTMPVPPSRSAAALGRAMADTLAALADPSVRVLAQATLFDGRFVGRADFLERTPRGWLVSDTKLARHANVAALLQVGAYAAMLVDAGLSVAPSARLVLGDGETRDDPLAEILPVYRARRARLEAVVAEHEAGETAAKWGDERWLACGRCATCQAEAETARDLLLVAGMRGPTRRRLVDAGVRTVEDLAASTGPVPEVRPQMLERLRAQARLQLAQDADGEVHHEVVSAEALRRMPRPSPGDVFFDFEGDPLWRERGSAVWGLEYLFGCLTVDRVADGGSEEFVPFWAHDRAQEKSALVAFVDWLTARRRRWPDLHVYHYAPYEPAALFRLAARHGVHEDEVDQLLRDDVLVDLYAVVRGGIRVSQRSYSIKKLEPLYMAARDGEVQGGAESIVAYHEYEQALVEGRGSEAAERLHDIALYNRKDCESTWRLRDWLLERRAEVVDPDEPWGPAADDVTEVVVSDVRRQALDLEAAVRAHVDPVPRGRRSADDRAVALVGASVLFHAREDKPKWQEHYERLRLPVGDWRAADGVFLVEHAEVLTDWHRSTPKQRPRRILRLHGEPMRSTPLGTTAKVSAVYGTPPPAGIEAEHRHANARSTATVTVLDAVDSVGEDGRLRQTLTLEELQPKDGGDHVDLPVALVPNDNVSSAPIDRALAEIAEYVRDHGRVPVGAGTDLLLRQPPRLRDGGPLPVVGTGPDASVAAVTAALLAMDDSYVAVQGPPGTGKTHVGAHVIARLVEQGWAVGVCAQSHAAVENVLTKVVSSGVDGAQVAKVPRHTADPSWTALGDAKELAGFAAEHRAADRGYVVGGTAWDLTNPARVGRRELDLLVVDEAGQFSLAKTLAVSVAARRLLLLGDPQQLPQVTTGTHAEPIDVAALAWLAGDEAVLPASLGYFLGTTWRMHPALTRVVSDLAYDGRLEAETERTTSRTLKGVDPGLHVRLVDHRDNSTHSDEEAEEVVRLVRDLLGREWDDPADVVDGAPAGPRPLAERDVVVITPYNSQVGRIRQALLDAGLTEVAERVGTVDRFQGQEAAVAIVSMAASSHTDVSRGIGFLLDRHRLNVAVSRGKHSAFLVRSAVLTEFSPRSPEELVALGAFLRLCDAAVTTEMSPVVQSVPV